MDFTAATEMNSDLSARGPFKIVKAHVRGRKYVAAVLDFRLPPGERQVYVAPIPGWTKASRTVAYNWAMEQMRNELSGSAA